MREAFLYNNNQRQFGILLQNFNRDEKLKLLGKLNHLPAYNADQACLQHQKPHNALSPEVFYNTIANVLYLSSSNRPFFK